MSRTINYLVQELIKDADTIDNMSMSEFKAWCILQNSSKENYQNFLELLESYEFYDKCLFVKELIEEIDVIDNDEEITLIKIT